MKHYIVKRNVDTTYEVVEIVSDIEKNTVATSSSKQKMIDLARQLNHEETKLKKSKEQQQKQVWSNLFDQ